MKFKALVLCSLALTLSLLTATQNGAIINLISNTCAFPFLTSKNVGSEKAYF